MDEKNWRKRFKYRVDLSGQSRFFQTLTAARILEEALQMQEAQHETGKTLNIGVVCRFNAAVNDVRRRIMAGELGEVYHVFINFRQHRSIPGLGGAFTTKAQSGGGVLIDLGVHIFDLILYILGGAKIKNVTCDAYNEMAKDMKSYKCFSMWALDKSDIENGTNDVDDYITGYVRTDKSSISFNGSWAQNIGEEEFFIDFLGDKGGARLDYGGQFTFWDGATLERTRSNHDIPNMFLCEDKAFLEAIDNEEKTKTHIDNILETMKLLDTLYQSSDIKKEITF